MRVILDGVDDINEFIANWTSGVYRQSIDNETEVENTVKESDCFREYGKLYSIPTFRDVYPNGKIALKRGIAEHYDIHTIIELKRLIPLTDEYPKFIDLKKAVKSKADQVTIKRVCHVIEHGGAEHIINKWNSMPLKYDEYGHVI